MRKLILFLFILTIGVFTTACVNTFAVHELNQIAAEFLDVGDIDSAISRLESAIDLDDNNYESRYNLAVAYMRKNMCKEALEHIIVADKLIKNEPAVEYTYGVASHCVAELTIHPKDKDGNDINTKNFTQADKNNMHKSYIGHLEKAIEKLDNYTVLAPNADDTKEAINLITRLKEELSLAKAQYSSI